MNKLEYLNGLRGIASLIVVIHHFITAFLPAIYLGKPELAHHPYELFFYMTPLSVLFNGNFMVCIFFVLSGYILSYKYFLTNTKPNIVTASLKRYIRLGLPVFATIVLAYTLMKLQLLFHHEITYITKSEWLTRLWQFTPNIAHMLKSGLYGALVNGDSAYYTNLWTMEIEFKGSLLTYLFLVLFIGKKYRYIMYIPLIIAFINTYYLAIILGVLLADSTLRYREELQKSHIPKIGLLLLSGIGLFFGSYPITAAETKIRPFLDIQGISSIQDIQFLHTLGALIILIVVVCSKTVQRFLSKRVPLFLGSISYALYLTHLLIIGSFSSYIFKQLITTFSYYTSFALMFLLSFPLVILTAYIFTKLVDAPAIKRSKLLFITRD
jgi:peptidoglycan/LPS O-acetylase OafA/YrhL